MFYEKQRLGMPKAAAFVVFFALLVFVLSATAFGQTSEAAQNQTAAAAAQKVKMQTSLQPVLTEYKGVKIGMTADEARDKLDKKPVVEDKTGFYYVFSDEESAQIVLDADKKVRVISIMYADKEGKAPKYEDVFGKEVPVATMPDGRIYNLIRYPEAGIWVAYNRTTGDNPLVTITIQKMRRAK